MELSSDEQPGESLDRLDALTKTDRRIAELHASGLSTAEIAERLYISGPMATVHVAMIYGKLKVSTRDELRLMLDQARKRQAGPDRYPRGP